MRNAVFVLLLWSGPILAAPPPAPAPSPTPIVFPEVVVPQPPPPPPPTAVTRLTLDTLYVIQANVDAIVLSSPEGLVSISQDAGPLKVRGHFVEDPTKFQTRIFTSKWVFTVDAVATGRCEILVIPVGASKPADIYRRVLDVEATPLPPPAPPGPTPPGPTPPGPTPPPVPVPVKDLRVLVVYETAALSKMPPGKLHVLFAQTFRDFLAKKVVVGADGKTPERRFYDKDDDMTNAPPVFKELMARPRTEVPWIVLHGGGKVIYEGPLPGSVDETIALVNKYAG